MILNLSAANRRQVNNHRNCLIEEAFKASKQHGYRMPRKETSDSEEDVEDIEGTIDLHEQNGMRRRGIVSVRDLVRMNSRSKMNQTQLISQKMSESQLEEVPSQSMVSRMGRI